MTWRVNKKRDEAWTIFRSIRRWWSRIIPGRDSSLRSPTRAPSSGTRCISADHQRGAKHTRGLRAVRSEDEAREAIGALRELLELEDLLVTQVFP
jgi:hypothetical protein